MVAECPEGLLFLSLRVGRPGQVCLAVPAQAGGRVGGPACCAGVVPRAGPRGCALVGFARAAGGLVSLSLAWWGWCARLLGPSSAVHSITSRRAWSVGGGFSDPLLAPIEPRILRGHGWATQMSPQGRSWTLVITMVARRVPDSLRLRCS